MTESHGLEALQSLSSNPAPEAAREPQIDKDGRAYATGKRKNAVARVWIKPGKGKVTINGRDQETYFARPVLRMMIAQPLQVADRLGNNIDARALAASSLGPLLGETTRFQVERAADGAQALTLLLMSPEFQRR